MAYSSPDIGDNLDELNCSVCLDIYEEPVGLPCGHSFCCVCIEKYWESREEDTYCVCPNCREVFPQKPKLKKNVTIAYLVEKIVNVKKGMKSGGTGSLCEVCDRKASKRCVPCEILCCEIHVKPHQEKGHKLVEPGMNVEELRCTRHGKPIHLYCKDDGSFLCLMCMAGEHRDHKFVPLEITHTELKDVLAEKYPQVSNSMEDLEAELQDLQQKVVQTQGHTDLVKRLESVLQFRSLSMAPSTVLGISQEEKNLDLLVKVYKNILKEIQKDPVKELEVVELDQIIMRSFYGRTPSLDPNSANPRIKISQDLRTATLTGTERPYPEHPDRFDYWFQVVSSESFSSGRHYWEVDVSSSGSYGIGICLNSMERKGGFSGLGMNPESWCLEKHNNKYTACHSDQDTLLYVPGDPDQFGFFLDCEAGELTCFGDSRVLHVFRGDFMDPIKPAIGVHYPVGGSIQFFSF